MFLEMISTSLKNAAENIAFFGVGWFFVVVVFSAAFAGAVILAGFFFYQGIRTHLARDRATVVAVLSIVQSMVSLCVLLAVVLTGVRFLRGPYYIPESEKAAAAELPEVDRSVLLVLQNEESWSALDADSRVEVLQVLVDAERAELGILRPVTLRAEPLDGSLGLYEDDKSLIRIDLEHLMTSPAKNVARTICHESYHCYEHRLMEVFAEAESQSRSLLIFRSAANYHSELADDHYISPKEDPEGYAAQICENDAYNYASAEVEKYFG